MRRIYDVLAVEEGNVAGRSGAMRVLVDRLWPRGVSKQKAALDAWWKELAPSDGLRKAIHDGTVDWPTFEVEYRAELDARPVALAAARDAASEVRPVLLLTAAKGERTHAHVLLDVLTASGAD